MNYNNITNNYKLYIVLLSSSLESCDHESVIQHILSLQLPYPPSSGHSDWSTEFTRCLQYVNHITQDIPTISRYD